jgi:nifR3 family TIM-barrel protein
MNYVRPLQVGKLQLRTNIMYSPLAGCSDVPFRQMAALFRPSLVFCEMVKMDALIRNDRGTFRMLDYTPNMHPIGAQLCGSKVEIAAASARIVEDLGFDLIDLNCGCPVDKVTKDGSGSALLKNPEKIGEIVSKIVSEVSIPVTVKVRAGWDDDQINCEEVTRIAEEAGAKIIFVHGRTREQAYRGPAKWDYIRRAKKAAKKILVIGNGDIFSPENAKEVLDTTGCDGVLLSRGTLGAPWIAEDVERFLTGQSPIERPESFVHKMLLQHFSFIKAYQDERRAVLDMRRVGCWYLKSFPFSRVLRDQLNKAKLLSEVEAILNDSCLC